MALAERWELGSEFHWPPVAEELGRGGRRAAEPARNGLPAHAGPSGAAEGNPWPSEARFFGCGRDALRALVASGQATRGWRRLWVPSYFCQQVVESLLSTGISIRLYPDCPGTRGLELHGVDLAPGDVLLSVNLFGLRGKPACDGAPPGAEVIEDHTHDPWSDWARHSSADWCVASLRKTLPVPDGAVLWSPRRHALPQPAAVTTDLRHASLAKFTAMVLKGLYLRGHAIEKAAFRELATDGEEALSLRAISGMSPWAGGLLATFPINAWRERRRRNHQALTEALSRLPWIDVLQAEAEAGAIAFSGILIFDTQARRERVRQRLIAASIYPAILWPLGAPAMEGIPDAHRDLSARMLSIPCDMRYVESDMDRLARSVERAGQV